MRKRDRLVRAAVTLCALCMLPGCAWIRDGYRGLRNDDLTGHAAPALEGGTWILPDGVDARDAERTDRTRLLVFFLPG